jgi:hypothetical protein
MGSAVDLPAPGPGGGRSMSSRIRQALFTIVPAIALLVEFARRW